jgi:hypothetical protein
MLQDLVWDIVVKNFSVNILRVILNLRLCDFMIQAYFRASDASESVCYPLFTFRLC